MNSSECFEAVSKVAGTGRVSVQEGFVRHDKTVGGNTEYQYSILADDICILSGISFLDALDRFLAEKENNRVWKIEKMRRELAELEGAER